MERKVIRGEKKEIKVHSVSQSNKSTLREYMLIC